MVIKLYYYSVRKVFLNKVKLLSFLKFKKIMYFLYTILYKYVNSIVLKNQYLHLFIDKKHIINCFTFLKYNVFILCNQLLDFFVVDNLELIINQKNRIEFVYVFLSNFYNIRIFVHGFLSIFDMLPSISLLFNSSN
jgi:NADH:ubiquinone oxidoreductase subunit C